jgi:metallo-beta-lactamase family protein
MADDLANSNHTPTVTFWGAARSISGSLHLIEAGPHRILLDCGLTQGRNEVAQQRNKHFPFHPRQIDAVVISHAHIDHGGNLPTLVRQGFFGPVFCTAATRDLLALMLADSARIHEEEAAHANIIRQYRKPWLEPLYFHHDALQAMQTIIPLPYEQPRELLPGVYLTFHDAGHILGSAMAHLAFAAGGSVTYTGDVGRRGHPMLQPVHAIPPAALVICESTYGGRLHDSFEAAGERLADVVRRTAERGGKILIPAFSLGRTQLVIHYLCQAMNCGDAPRVPIYVDSPLAADIVDVYRRHPDTLSESENRRLAQEPDFLSEPSVHYIRSFEESAALSAQREPCVIVAASGMCEAGRIVHHLKHHVDDPRCSVVLVSYQAPGTLGRQLLERGPTVRFLGKNWNKWAEIVHLDGFSGHADRDDFVEYFRPLAGKIGRICLVHGEAEQAETLALALRDAGHSHVSVPAVGDEVPLTWPARST